MKFFWNVCYRTRNENLWICISSIQKTVDWVYWELRSLPKVTGELLWVYVSAGITVKNSSTWAEEGAMVKWLQPPTDMRILTFSSVPTGCYLPPQQSPIIMNSWLLTVPGLWNKWSQTGLGVSHLGLQEGSAPHPTASHMDWKNPPFPFSEMFASQSRSYPVRDFHRRCAFSKPKELITCSSLWQVPSKILLAILTSA